MVDEVDVTILIFRVLNDEVSVVAPDRRGISEGVASSIQVVLRVSSIIIVDRVWRESPGGIIGVIYCVRAIFVLGPLERIDIIELEGFGFSVFVEGGVVSIVKAIFPGELNRKLGWSWLVEY